MFILPEAFWTTWLSNMRSAILDEAMMSTNEIIMIPDSIRIRILIKMLFFRSMAST
ncbi:hypothetical protein D3C71_1440240 [compost metagenome]